MAKLSCIKALYHIKQTAVSLFKDRLALLRWGRICECYLNPF